MDIIPNPYLEWLDESSQIQRLEIIDKIFVGRTCKGIDARKRILLQNLSVSRDHAEISWAAGHLQITDTSKNGTWVNSIRMAAGSSRDLADEDIIRIGESLFRVIFPKKVCDDEDDLASTDSTKVFSIESTVTNLVADMRGFSGYSQTHKSSDVFLMIKEIFEQFGKIIEDFKGTIKDYAGDSIIAFWEHQVDDLTTHSVLACQAAIRQMENFDNIRIHLAGKYADVETLQMGWGITTGPVTMSHFGSRAADLVIVGDCINLACRLSGMANREVPENILICAHTAALVEKQLKIKDLGMLPIRGREGKEHIFALRAHERIRSHF